MAIEKVGVMTTGPVNDDWTKLMAHVLAYNNQIGGGGVNIITSDGKIAQGAYMQFGGVLYQVKDEDYTIENKTSGTYLFPKMVLIGGVLKVYWQIYSDISSWGWNTTYNYYYSGNEALLPYRVYYDGSTYTVHPNTPFTNQRTKTASDVMFHDINSTGDITASGESNIDPKISYGDSETLRIYTHTNGDRNTTYTSHTFTSHTFTLGGTLYGTAKILLQGYAPNDDGYIKFEHNGVRIGSEYNVSQRSFYTYLTASITISPSDTFKIYARNSGSNSIQARIVLQYATLSGMLNILWAERESNKSETN